MVSSRLVALAFILWGPIAVAGMLLWAGVTTLVDACGRRRRSRRHGLTGQGFIGRPLSFRSTTVADEAQEWLRRRAEML